MPDHGPDHPIGHQAGHHGGHHGGVQPRYMGTDDETATRGPTNPVVLAVGLVVAALVVLLILHMAGVIKV